jgi:hypothetical protein
VTLALSVYDIFQPDSPGAAERVSCWGTDFAFVDRTSVAIVVADATPLHYLVLIGAIEILPGLFDKIHVSIEIREELSR